MLIYLHTAVYLNSLLIPQLPALDFLTVLLDCEPRVEKLCFSHNAGAVYKCPVDNPSC